MTKIKKDFFQLWYEYLKESDDYRKYCEWMRERRRLLRTDPPSTQFIPPPPEGLEKSKNFPRFQLIFEHWDDIHTFSFEECLEAKKDYFQEEPLIVDYHPILEKYMERYIDNYKESQGKEPSLREFKDWFFAPDKVINPWNLYLRVDITGKSVSKLMEEFREIAIQRKKDPLVKQITESSKTLDRDIKEKRRYLEVFRLEKRLRSENRQGLSWPEIIKKLDPNHEIHKIDDEYDRERAWKRDLQNAKEIIASVECGYFPQTPTRDPAPLLMKIWTAVKEDCIPHHPQDDDIQK